MELTLDLHVRRDVNESLGNEGFKDIMHETIDESDLLEFMQKRMGYECIVIDSVTVTSITP